MYQHQLADDLRRERLAYAAQSKCGSSGQTNTRS